MLIRFASIGRHSLISYLLTRKLVKNLTTRLFVPVLYLARPTISVIMTPLFHLIRSIYLAIFCIVLCARTYENGTTLKQSIMFTHFTWSSATLEEDARRNKGFNKSPIAKTDVVANIVAALGQLTNGPVDERVSIIALIASMIDHRWCLYTRDPRSREVLPSVTIVLTWQIPNFEEHGKCSHRYRSTPINRSDSLVFHPPRFCFPKEIFTDLPNKTLYYFSYLFMLPFESF